MRSYFHTVTCILPLECSGSQPDDEPMWSKHVVDWIILWSCFWWLSDYSVFFILFVYFYCSFI